MKQQRLGYMLVFSMMMVALIAVMVTALVDRARVHITTMQTLLDREKARQLALSGLEIAKCRIANPPEGEKKEEQKTAPAGQAQQVSQKQDPTQEARNLLSVLLPSLATWQTFTVEQGKNIYGTIKVNIGCEQGKLNLNELYDYVKHAFINEDDKKKTVKPFIEQVCVAIEKAHGGKGLFEKLSNFLKERKFPLNDPTEILNIKEFSAAFQDALFFEPIETEGKERSKEGSKRPLYLMDLFTIWSKEPTLEPWLLSPSLKQIVEFKQQIGKEQEKTITQALQKFSISASWSGDWNQRLAPLYGKEVNSLSPSLVAMLSTKFEPMVFSVVSYGSIKNVTQRLYAIVERKRSSSKDGPLYEIVVKRLYWI